MRDIEYVKVTTENCPFCVEGDSCFGCEDESFCYITLHSDEIVKYGLESCICETLDF